MNKRIRKKHMWKSHTAKDLKKYRYTRNYALKYFHSQCIRYGTLYRYAASVHSIETNVFNLKRAAKWVREYSLHHRVKLNAFIDKGYYGLPKIEL